VSLLTCATAGPSWPQSGPTMKWTFSWSATRRACVSAWSGLHVVSPVITSTLRPPAVYCACSQKSVKPSCMSLPGEGGGRVRGGRGPIGRGAVRGGAGAAASGTAGAAGRAGEGDVRTAGDLLGLVFSLLGWSVTGRALVRGPFVGGFRPIILPARR